MFILIIRNLEEKMNHLRTKNSHVEGPRVAKINPVRRLTLTYACNCSMRRGNYKRRLTEGERERGELTRHDLTESGDRGAHKGKNPPTKTHTLSHTNRCSAKKMEKKEIESLLYYCYYSYQTPISISITLTHKSLFFFLFLLLSISVSTNTYQYHTPKPCFLCLNYIVCFSLARFLLYPVFSLSHSFSSAR